MVITPKDKKRVLLLIRKFIQVNSLSQYSIDEIIYIDDTSEGNMAAASITIDSFTKKFVIRVYTVYVDSYKTLCEMLLHELTHLYLYEINDFNEFLIRHNADQFVVKELAKVYEDITYRLTKVFEQIYLEGM